MKLAWTNRAKSDLVQIRKSSIDRWGRDVAIGYLQDIRDAAKDVAISPSRSKLLRHPFRLRSVRSHYLIAHADDLADRVTVACILQTAMDIERHLDPTIHIPEG